MNSYKGVTGKDRLKSWELTKLAIKNGVIPKPTQCALCGKTAGRIDYHSETYKSPTDDLIQICQGCHMRWHNRSRFKESFMKFFVEKGLLQKINADMIATLKSENLINVIIKSNDVE